jgi:hypothetical protein
MKDRKGNIKLKKSGLPQTHNSHKECYRKKVTDWKNLISFFEPKYFALTPKELCVQLKQFAKRVEYKQMLDCFKFMEENIDRNLEGKTFLSESNFGNYLFAVLTNHIRTFEKRKKQKELETKHELYQLDNDNTIFIDRSKYKGTQIKSINYDILD